MAADTEPQTNALRFLRIHLRVGVSIEKSMLCPNAADNRDNKNGIIKCDILLKMNWRYFIFQKKVFQVSRHRQKF